MRDVIPEAADDVDAAYAELTSICEALRQDAIYHDSVRAHVEAAALMLREIPPLRIVACGEYGRGKSTLLSALAGRRMFPHLPNDRTSVATTLRWGPVETATALVAAPDGSMTSKTIDPGQVQLFVTDVGNRSITEAVVRVQIEAPLDSVARGLELVDTPGVNSPNPTHSLITQDCLERAGVILLVTSTDGPLTELELGAFEKAAMTGTPVIAVVTKKDANEASSAGDVIRGRLGRNVEVLVVSAEMALQGRDERDLTLEHDSGVPELYRRLTGLGTAHRARHALGQLDDPAPGDARTPVASLAAALKALRESAASELETIRQAEQEAEAFSNAREDARRKLDWLEEAAGHFHREVRDQVTQTVGEIRREVSQSCDSLILQTTLDIASASPTTSPAAYQASLVQALGRIASWADAALERFLASVVGEARRLTESELSYTPAMPAGSPLPQGAPVPGPGRPARIRFDALREGISGAGKVAAFGGSVGAAVGGLVAAAPGAALGAAIGALVGQLVGAVAGTRDAMERDDKAREAAGFRQVALSASAWIKAAESRIADRLSANAPAEIDSLSRSVDSLIAQRRAQLRVQQEQAQSNDAADRAERDARSGQLTEQLVALGRLEGTLTRASDRLRLRAEPGGSR